MIYNKVNLLSNVEATLAQRFEFDVVVSTMWRRYEFDVVILTF